MNYIYRNNNNYNDDINSYQNKNIKLDYQGKSVSSSNKNNISMPQNLNYQNKNKINENENFKNLNNNFNFSSSLKDQILSPGDDDISQNYDKNIFPIKKGSQYLDDDIITNFRHYLDERRKDKFTFAIEEENEKIIMQYKEKNDTIIGYLNDDESIVSRANFDINKTVIFEDYKKYCRDNKLIPLPRKKFYLEILAKSDIKEYHKDGYKNYRRKSKEDT